MSYDIYKSIKQLEDGSFECVVASSNCFNYDNTRAFSKSVITYFNREFPDALNEEKRACWLLYSTYSGDKFYPSNWKADQKLAYQFLNEINKSYRDFAGNAAEHLFLAREFLTWRAERIRSRVIKKYIVKVNDYKYVSKKSSTRLYCVMDKEGAKVFKKDLDELKEMLKPWAHCSLSFIEVS